ncbi:hypothetical protein BDAP_002355 [Binucleata daphniae]
MTIEDVNKSSDIVFIAATNKKNKENNIRSVSEIKCKKIISNDKTKNEQSYINNSTDTNIYLPNTSLINESDLHIVNTTNQKQHEAVTTIQENQLGVDTAVVKKHCNKNNKTFVYDTAQKIKCKNNKNNGNNIDLLNYNLCDSLVDVKCTNTSFSTIVNKTNSSFLPNNSQSTSLLEIPWIKKTSEPQKVEVKHTKILPAFHDPIFLDYNFKIPKTLQKIIDSAKNINFTYEIEDSNNHFEICKDSNVIKRIDCMFYGENITTNNTILFFIDQTKYVKRESKKEDAKYKESITNKTKYKPKNIVQCYRQKIFMHQIKNKVNIFYLEYYEDLLCALKSIVKEIEKPRKYIQKVKTFGSNKKKEYCEYVIQSVPGISKNVANAISLYFENFSKFYNFLKNDYSKVVDLTVYSDDKKSQRKLGEKQALLLKKAFLCDKPNTNIKE